jgi:hypothetical protein
MGIDGQGKSEFLKQTFPQLFPAMRIFDMLGNCNAYKL